MIKKFYTESEVQAAKNVNLIDFLNSKFPHEIFYNKPRGRWCRNDCHHIVILTERQRYKTKPFLTWSDFSLGDENNSADNIEYLRRFHDMNFKEAVSELLSFNGKMDIELNESLSEYHDKLKKSPKKPANRKPNLKPEFISKIRDYLINERCLDAYLIHSCIEKGLIYPSSIFGSGPGICFYNPESKFYIFREINSSDIKRNAAGDDYWIIKTSEEISTVYITEAPIDALSLCQLLKHPSNSAFIAMGGLKVSTAEKVISDFPDSKILISTDWDKPGNDFFNNNFKGRFTQFTPSDKYLNVCKDWNDFLRLLKASKAV